MTPGIERISNNPGLVLDAVPPAGGDAVNFAALLALQAPSAVVQPVAMADPALAVSDLIIVEPGHEDDDQIAPDLASDAPIDPALDPRLVALNFAALPIGPAVPVVTNAPPRPAPLIGDSAPQPAPTHILAAPAPAPAATLLSQAIPIPAQRLAEPLPNAADARPVLMPPTDSSWGRDLAAVSEAPPSVDDQPLLLDPPTPRPISTVATASAKSVPPPTIAPTESTRKPSPAGLPAAGADRPQAPQPVASAAPIVRPDRKRIAEPFVLAPTQQPAAFAPRPAQPGPAMPADPVTSPPTLAEVTTPRLGGISVAIESIPGAPVPGGTSDRLRVHFTVERAATADLLSAARGTLDQSLTAGGARLEQLYVQVRGADPLARPSEPSLATPPSANAVVTTSNGQGGGQAPHRQPPPPPVPWRAMPVPEAAAIAPAITDRFA